MKPMTRDVLARLFFRHDQDIKMHPRSVTFESLPPEDLEYYYEQADHYLPLPVNQWPIEIVHKLPEET